MQTTISSNRLLTAEEHCPMTEDNYRPLPPGTLSEACLEVAPDLVFEVRSHAERWAKMLLRVSEHLQAGVGTVCVLDSRTATLAMFFPDDPPRVLQVGGSRLPDLMVESGTPLR